MVSGKEIGLLKRMEINKKTSKKDYSNKEAHFQTQLNKIPYVVQIKNQTVCSIK